MKPYLYLAISLLMMLSSCMSEHAVIKKYYTIEWQIDQNDAHKAAASVIRGACEIKQIEISPLYEGNQIVNRSNSHEITYYKYHQWAVRPSVAITEVIRNSLEISGTFESVSTRYSRIIPDYRFVTVIHQLEIIENSEAFSAHLNLEFRIINNSNDQVLLNYKADRREPLPEKELNLFASAVSNLIYKELQEFISQIEKSSHLFEKTEDQITND